MPVLVIALFGSAVFGNSFFKYGYGSLTILNLLILVCCLTYLTVFIANRRGLVRFGEPDKGDKLLWALLLFGCMAAGLSYAGAYSSAGLSEDLLLDSSFIPRRAYYLFFIPLILLAGRFNGALPMLGFLRTHSRLLFLAVYLAYVVVQGTVELNVPVCFCLAVLLLMGDGRGAVARVLLLCLVLFSPIRTGGEMTQVIMRILLAAAYFFGDEPAFFKAGVVGSLCVVLACYVLPFFSLGGFGLDANTMWRAQYWLDELSQVIDSFGLGVGYGTSYATVGFAGSAISGPFAATADYSTTEKLFVVGCHNSFVSLTFRLGIVGAVLLISYLMGLSRRDEEYYRGVCVFGLFRCDCLDCYRLL